MATGPSLLTLRAPSWLPVSWSSLCAGQTRARARTASATLDWKTHLDARGQLLLFEAFVSHQVVATDDGPHIRDAKLAITKFREGMRDPLALNSAIDEPNCLNLVEAALLRTGWATDLSILSQRCLVVRRRR